MARPGLRAMTSDLRNRLLVLLVLPLAVLVLVSATLDFRSADDAALQHDQRLLRLLPALADSVVAGSSAGAGPLLLLAPSVEEFLRRSGPYTAFSVRTVGGDLLLGEDWVQGPLPRTAAAEFHSMEFGGVTYRVAAQRGQTDAGELVVALADGSDSRQQWLQQLVLRVLLPNLLLVAAAGVAIHWAVGRAFKPLVDLANKVERRSARDLNPIDVASSPQEVRPLVHALNHLFDLVRAQMDSQRRFVADAAHQLRTPLAGLQAQVEAWALLARSGGKERNFDEKWHPAPIQQAQAAITLGVDEIEKLRAATRRTSQLAHQLLALSRADARSIDAAAMQRVDLKELCEVALELHLDAAAAKAMDLGLETQPVHATGHDWLLRELLSNLVDNAIKYAPIGGRVTIRCGRTTVRGALRAYLEVEDDGPGIAASEYARVLQRFYRIPGTAGEGTGLGLPIADEIARAHGSTLQLMRGAAQRGLLVRMLFAPEPAAPAETAKNAVGE
jgi:two-component system sensor histidine kinase TctE